MTKTTLPLFLLFFIYSFAFGQPQQFNLGFEQNKTSAGLPDGWITWGSYLLSKDTVTKYSGTYAGLITASEDGSEFGSIAYKIPAQYEGKEITLEGYMKIENAKDGFAGLLMRLDGKSDMLGFDNMQNQAIQGTLDWKKYSITLPYSNKTEEIYVAGILVGKGKAWFDHFSVTIDGVPIENKTPIEKPKSKAELDTEFDKSSKIQFEQLNKQSFDNLAILCKVWGFMKYNHPEIAKGNINWDYELFRVMSAIKSTEFKSQLSEWIGKQGSDFDVNIDFALTDTQTIKLQTRTTWLKDEILLSPKICSQLSKIEKAKKESENYYLSFALNVGNPSFENENPYPNMEWDDDGYKLLALFRYWNMIEYFFPYRHLMDENWETVLQSFIPRLVESEDELSYKLIMLDLISKIQDTHANIWGQDSILTQFHGERNAPIEINFIENQAVVVRIFDQLDSTSSIEVGDIITHINGQSIEKMVKEKAEYCPASNYPTQLRDVSRKLFRTNEQSISISLKNSKTSFDEKVVTTEHKNINFWKKDIPSHKELDDDIGYIYPGSLERGEVDLIMKKFMQKKGLVIDLRCYPSDFIVFSLGKYLMPEPTEFVKFTSGSIENTGQFSFGPSLKVGESNPDYYKGNVVILINETTQSQAEYTTMALRVAPNATVIGSTTAAADGNVSRIFLPGKIRTMISGIGVYYPDGTETQRVGIVPNIELKQTIKGIRSGKDELLQKAIEIIKIKRP